MALFRLAEVEAVSIYIDGVDLRTIGLRVLRGSLAMIPQEAVLIEGTVRENLDPFDSYSTKQLEVALQKVVHSFLSGRSF